MKEMGRMILGRRGERAGRGQRTIVERIQAEQQAALP